MDNVGAGSGGGIHPGAPFIWPTIKPTTTESTSSTQSTQSTSNNTPVNTSSSSATATSILSQSSVTRSLSTHDLALQLLQIGVADSKENHQLAVKMLEHGLELSKENFDQLFGALQNKGNSPSSQQAAFTALAKGLANNPSAVNALEQFFSGTMSAAQQSENLSQQLESLARNLAQTPNLLNQGLTANLSSLLTEFDSRLKQMSNKDKYLNQNNVALSSSDKETLNKLLNNLPQDQKEALNTLLTKNAPLSTKQEQSLQQILKGSVSLEDLQKELVEDLLLSKKVLPEHMKQSLSNLIEKNPSVPRNQQEALNKLFSSSPSLNNEQREFLSIIQNSSSLSPQQKILVGDLLQGNYSQENLIALEEMTSTISVNIDQKIALNTILHSLASPKLNFSFNGAKNALPNLPENALQDIAELLAVSSNLGATEKKALASVLSELGLMDSNHKQVLSNFSQENNLSIEQKISLETLLNSPDLLKTADLSALTDLMDSGLLDAEQLFSLKQLMMQMQNQPTQMPINWVQDFSAMQSLIKGIYKQLSNQQLDEKGEQLLESLKQLDSSLTKMIANMTVQGVLSKASMYNDPSLPDKYYYWMIPNPFSEQQKDIEILVKRDSTKDGSPINPNKTQIILKTETDTMGDIAVVMDINEKELSYIFNADNESTRQYIAANSAILRSQMKVLDYDVKSFQSQIKKVNINKILSPTIDLDKLRRISAEA
jgi:hypothetical protein